jgi:hypothetical protein
VFSANLNRLVATVPLTARHSGGNLTARAWTSAVDMSAFTSVMQRLASTRASQPPLEPTHRAPGNVRVRLPPFLGSDTKLNSSQSYSLEPPGITTHGDGIDFRGIVSLHGRHTAPKRTRSGKPRRSRTQYSRSRGRPSAQSRNSDDVASIFILPPPPADARKRNRTNKLHFWMQSSVQISLG